MSGTPKVSSGGTATQPEEPGPWRTDSTGLADGLTTTPSADLHQAVLNSEQQAALNASELALLISTANVAQPSDASQPSPNASHMDSVVRCATSNSATTDFYPSRNPSPRHHSHSVHHSPVSGSPRSRSPRLKTADSGVMLQGQGIQGHVSPVRSRTPPWELLDNAVSPQRYTHSQPSPRRQPARSDPTDAVDRLLQQYHTTSQLPLALHLRTQRQIHQLHEYHKLKETLQAAQATMLSNMGGVQSEDSPTLQDPKNPVSPSELRHHAKRHATSGRGVAPVSRFNSPRILQEGLYVTSGEYSFAASPPYRSQPTASLLFERYPGHDDGIPTVQRFYLRPDRPCRPKSPPLVAYKPRQAPSGRRLPNGIPVCRLHSEQAALRSIKQGGTTRPGTGTTATDDRSHPNLVLPARTDPASFEEAMECALGSLGHVQGEGAREPGKLLTPREPGADSSGAVGPASVLADLGAASSLGAATAEPMLDDPFAALVKSHFSDMAVQQSQRLQRRLNAGLPVVLQSMGISSQALTTW